MKINFLQYVKKVGIIIIIYFVIDKIGLSLAVKYGLSSISPVSGLALGATLIYGYRIWPGILLGSMLAVLLSGYPLYIVILIATGNVLGALVGAFLLKRYLGSYYFFERPMDILLFTAIAGFVSPMVSATIGVGGLFLGGALPSSVLIYEWFLWWLSHSTGIILITPLIVSNDYQKQNVCKSKQYIEYVLLMVLLAITSHLIFSGLLMGTMDKSLSYKYLLLPFYFWLIFRFWQREIAVATIMVYLIGLWNTFDLSDIQTASITKELLISLNIFISFVMVVALFFKTIIHERKQMIEDMARLERLHLIGEMAASIAHEIRNPMTTVRGFLQMISKKENDNNGIFYRTMIDELDRANSIITEYLLLAKNKSIELKMKNINKVIRSLYPLMMADAINTNKTVEINLKKVPDILLDEKEIRQLILNIVKNGLEAMDSGGELSISTLLERNKLILSITDNGEGIPKNIIKKLGTPFFTTKEHGTGLGLAVSYSIAERHKAKINIESHLQGTTFHIIFPLTEDNGR